MNHHKDKRLTEMNCCREKQQEHGVYITRVTRNETFFFALNWVSSSYKSAEHSVFPALE